MLKKSSFVMLISVAVFSVASSVMAFNHEMIREMPMKVEAGIMAATSYDQGDPIPEYVTDFRRIMGSGTWIMYIPFQFQVPSGRKGTLKIYDARFKYFPDVNDPGWELLTPGSMTHTWGGIFMIVSEDVYEDVLLVGDMYSLKFFGSMSYLDLRADPKNVSLLAEGNASVRNLPVPSAKYYYSYGLILLNPGQMLKLDSLLKAYGNSNLIGFVVSDKYGILKPNYVPIKSAPDLFRGDDIVVAVWRNKK
jgi:hypothetical protein